MSHTENDKYFEELAEAEEDYNDALRSLKQADEDLQKAYDWKKKMIEKCDAEAARLLALRNKE
jgi:cellobiose-specific phosphotransferase system component IIA